MKGVQQVKRAYVLFALMLALGMLAALTMTAGAATPGPVTTNAVVTGQGVPPTVNFAWEVSPQMPTQPNVDIVCDGGVDTAACFDVIAVVGDPFGVGNISGAFFDVRHPDGSLKFQVHMTKLTDPAAIEAWISAGLANGSITTAQAVEIRLQIEKLQSVVYVGEWCYDVHQASGIYAVQVYATDFAGLVGGPLTLNPNILAKVCLAIDFASVDFGAIIPDVEKVVRGDDVFLAGDGRPTVWNQGNTPASLKLKNSEMIGAQWGKIIDDFDAKLRTQYIKYDDSQEVTMVGPLCTCTPIQIEFSVLAESPINVDTYTGTMNITIIPAVTGAPFVCPVPLT